MWEDFNFLWQELECLIPKLLFFIMYKSRFAMGTASYSIYVCLLCLHCWLLVCTACVYWIVVWLLSNLLQVYIVSTATTANVLETENKRFY